MMILDDEFPIDCLHSTGRRQFLYSLLALFLLARGKASVANTPGSDLFYVLDLRTDDVTAPPGNFIASGAPGSLLKLVLTAAFYEGRLPAAHQIVVCNGTTVVDGRRYSCRSPHGRMHLPLALGYSCNVFFANVIGQLSQPDFARALDKFGLHVAARSTLEHKAFRPAEFIDYCLGLTNEIIVDALDVLHMVALIALKGQIQSFSLHDPNRPLLRVCKNPFFHPTTWTA